MKTVSRSAGRSVVAAAAYRLGERLHDEVHDITHDYTRKRGVEATFTVTPEGSPAWVHEPEKLWNAAERAEKRINSTVGREIELALPSFLSPEERLHITERFAKKLVDHYKVAVSVAIHEPGRGGDQRNFHAHILFTTREMTPYGLGMKTRILDDRATGSKEVIRLRKLAADIINESLAAANSDVRVDHRSFEDRGIEREGTIHLGPKATGQERRGEATRAGDYNRHVEAYNRMLAERAEAEKAFIVERERQTSPPTTREDAQERARNAVAGFVKAIQVSGTVQTPQRDGLTWWQRTAVRVAEKMKDFALAVSARARGLLPPKEPARDEKGLER